MNLTFKGTKPSYVTVMDILAPVKAPVQWGTFNVPGLAGVILTEKTIDPIIIPVKFLIEGSDREEYERNKEDFADWLDCDKVEPLVMEHNSNRTYYAVTQGATVPDDELVIFSMVTVEFLVPRPYKYGPEKTSAFVNGAATIHNKGTIEVKPTIYAEVISDLSNLDIMSENKYMRIGQPLADGQAPLAAETLVLHNTLANLTGWAYGGLSVDGGVAVGSFVVDNGTFKPSDFGTGTVHRGPAIKQAVPQAPLVDWRTEIELKFLNPKDRGGRMEVYLLDDTGQHIGKLALVSRISSPNMVCEVRIGGQATYKFLIATANGTAWNNFDGVIRLQKKGNTFTAYIARIDPITKKHLSAKNVVFKDAEFLYIRNLSQIQLHAGVYNQGLPGTMNFKDLKVYRLNTVPPGDPRIIAKVGDIIELNFTNSAIFINGEERKELKDLFATFFKLPRGTSTLAIAPADKVTAIAVIREGYK